MTKAHDEGISTLRCGMEFPDSGSAGRERRTELNNALSGKRILITGASGFIGRRIVQQLSVVDCTIVALSRAPGPETIQDTARIEEVFGDIRDTCVLDSAMRGVDVVIHLAAQTSARTAEDDPRADAMVNVAPMTHIVASAERTHASIILASTSTIFGLPASLPVAETQPDAPLTAYDRHKLLAERLVQAYGKGASLRLTNVYGPGQSHKGADRGVLNAAIAKAISGEALTVFGDGSQLRDYLYIDDAARAFLMAAANAQALGGRPFVVGSGVGTRIRDAFALVATRVGEWVSRQVPVIFADPPAPPLQIDARNFVADARAFQVAAQWTAETQLQEGIDLTIDAVINAGGA